LNPDINKEKHILLWWIGVFAIWPVLAVLAIIKFVFTVRI
jgi:hypothetical protein